MKGISGKKYISCLGISHFLSIILGNMVEYSELVASFDGVVSSMEIFVQKVVHFLLHIVKLFQIILLGALGYFVFEFMHVYHLLFQFKC